MADTKRPALKLKITETLAKDAGRAFARMGLEDMEILSASTRDTLEIAGRRRTVCKAMPAYKEMHGQSRIQLDGITRENAGVRIDEFVAVSRIVCPQAERVAIPPINITPSERDSGYIAVFWTVCRCLRVTV